MSAFSFRAAANGSSFSPRRNSCPAGPVRRSASGTSNVGAIGRAGERSSVINSANEPTLDRSSVRTPMSLTGCVNGWPFGAGIWSMANVSIAGAIASTRSPATL